MSCDGRFVAYNSDASNLVSGDTNSQEDDFVYDHQANSFDRVNVSSSGAQSSTGAGAVVNVSDGGRYVAFSSPATDLVTSSTGGVSQEYLRDRTLGTTALVSKDTSSNSGDDTSDSPVISADGSHIAYESEATNLVTTTITTTSGNRGNFYVSDTGVAGCSE